MIKKNCNCTSNYFLSVTMSVLFLILSFIFPITSPFVSETGLYGGIGTGWQFDWFHSELNVSYRPARQYL